MISKILEFFIQFFDFVTFNWEFFPDDWEKKIIYLNIFKYIYLKTIFIWEYDPILAIK